MTRRQYIERCLREAYGGYVPQDSEITEGMVNNILMDAIAIAAKSNYTDAIKMDGVGYVNNSFYTTFKGLAAIKDENFLWKVSLPQIPVGIGTNEGVSNLRFKSTTNEVSLDCVPLSINQKGYNASMRAIPNKLLYYTEGDNCFVLTTIMLSQYTASVTMVSGGDSTDLDSELNVPSDYFPIMQDYIMKQLLLERAQPQDGASDGVDRK